MSYCFRKETYPQYTKRINEITRGKYSDIFTEKFVGDALSSEVKDYIDGKGKITDPEELAMKSIIMSYMASKIEEKHDGIKRSYPNKVVLGNKIVNCEPYQGNYNQVIKAINDNYREEKVVSEGQPAKQPESINIYAGTGENANLSNFAERPFEYRDIRFNNVEQAFQTAKLQTLRNIFYKYLNVNDSNKRIIAKVDSLLKELENCKTGAEAREIGRTKISSKSEHPQDLINKFFGDKEQDFDGMKEWNRLGVEMMKTFITESFKQNPEALKELLATGNATLTHTQDKGKWGKEFPRLLMEVREELGKEASKTVEQHKEIISDLGDGEEAKSEIKDAVQVAKEGVSFEDALKGQESIFTKEEQAQIKKALNGKNLKVMSVSRKTDPAFFSKEIVKFLEENSKKPFTDPTRVNAVEIWSKHDGMPIQDILDACKKYKVAPMMSFSITGLGGTSLEGGVMKYNDLLDRIEKLAKSGSLNPLTTTVRIDPILVGVTNMDDIRKIVERAKGIGVKKFVTSLVQSYGYTEGTPNDRKVISGINNALAKDGKTYDWDEFYGRDRNGKINFKPKKKYIDEIGKVLKELNEDPSITIQSCAFGIAGLKTSACLDPLIIERLTGLDIMSKDGKYDRDTSRPECMCYGAHGDFFAGQNKKCYSSCAYCYAAHSGDNALNYYDENGNLKVGGKIDYYTNVRTNDSQTQQPQQSAQQQSENRTKITVKGVDFVTTTSTDYPSRTRANANWSDITLHLATDFNTAGEKLTQRSAGEKLISGNLNDSVKDIVDGLLKQINDNNLPKDNIKLNVAGNGIYTLKDKFAQYELNDLVTTIISELQKNGISISEIRSGGQTGIDEAGVMAGKMLGIKSSVLTTSDWKFRNVNGKDISNEKSFKERFGDLIETEFKSQEQSSNQNNGNKTDKSNVLSTDKANGLKIYSNYQATDGLFSNISPVSEKDDYDKAIADSDSVVLFSVSQKEIDYFKNLIGVMNSKRDADKKITIAINPSGDYIKSIVKNNNSICMLKGKNSSGRVLDTLYSKASVVNNEKKFNNEDFIENKDMILYARKIQYLYNKNKKFVEDDTEIMKRVLNDIRNDAETTDDDYKKESLERLIDNWQHINKLITINEEIEDDIDDYDFESSDNKLFSEQHSVSSMPNNKIMKGFLASFPTGEIDELGTPIYYDPMVINNILVRTISGSKDSNEMMERLETEQRKNPFMNSIIDNINADDSGRLKSMLYKNYANLYKAEYITVSGNRCIDEGTAFATTSINIGIVSNPNPGICIFSDENTNINAVQNDLSQMFNGSDKTIDQLIEEYGDEVIELRKEHSDDEILEGYGALPFYSSANMEKLKYYLANAGMETDDKEHKLEALDKEEILLIRDLLVALYNERAKIKNDDFDANEFKQNNKNYFGQIIEKLNSISQQKTESIVRGGGESQFVWAPKNYIDGMMDGLHKDRENYVKDQYLKYEYFTSNWGKDYDVASAGIYSSLIRELALSPNNEWFYMKHFFVDKTDGDVQKFTGLDPKRLKGINQKVFWKEEFINEKKRKKGDTEYCFVHAPIYADSGSLHYYRVPKIGIEAVEDEQGGLSEPGIVKDIKNLIYLEVKRISAVKRRAELIKQGKLEPIAVYDTVEEIDKKTGKVKVKQGNGEKFMFQPILNEKDDDGNTLYDLLMDPSSNDEETRNEILNKYVAKIISNVISSDVSNIESSTQNSIDPNDLDSKGQSIYKTMKTVVDNVPLSIAAQKIYINEKDEFRKAIAKSLIYGKDLIENIATSIEIGDWASYNEFIEELGGRQFLMEGGDESYDNAMLGDLSGLNEFVGKSDFNPTYKDEIQRVLTSYIRTADIKQLTITDPALYKNDVDEQKRYKQVQAGYQRPDTNSKYAKEWTPSGMMRSITILDDEISLPEDTLDRMREWLTSNASKFGGNIDVEGIVNEFRNINVADAQSYRTLSSYRAVKDMFGEWTSKDEALYQKLMSEEPLTAEDYEVVWQTLKPFVYTQQETTWKDENGNTHYTKVGYQYKNSENTLFNMYLMLSVINKEEQMSSENNEGNYFETSDGKSVNANIIQTEIGALGDFGVRTTKKLKESNIRTIGDLISMKSGDVFKLVGSNGYNSISSAIKSLGLDFGTDISKIKTPKQSTNPIKKAVEKVLTRLGAINKFMEDYHIDTIQFQSAVKVGQQGVLDLNNTTAEDVYSTLEELTGVNKTQDVECKSGMGGSPEVIHEIPYSEWGIKTSTPPHMYDTEQQLGSQLKKICTADIPEGTMIPIDDIASMFEGDEIKIGESTIKIQTDDDGRKTLSKEDFLKLYNALMSGMILDNYEKVQKVFKDKEALSEELLKIMGSSPKYDYDIKQAVMIKDGDFVVDMKNSIIKDKATILLSSVLKNNINKQLTRGGTAIQMACWGGDNLQIHYRPDGTIEYMECYMPAYSKKFIEAYMNKDGIIDVNKCKDDNLLKALCYRVPTEDIYSMIPLKIKGFTPMQFGTNIMLPKEITKLTGSDFDVDKMYMFLPDFEMSDEEWSVKKEDALDEFKKSSLYDYAKKWAEGDVSARNRERTKRGKEELSGEDKKRITDSIIQTYFREFCEQKGYLKLKPKYIKYDNTKSVNENSYSQKANMLLSMMRAVISAPHNVTKAQNPGGFDYLKDLAKKINPEVNKPMNMTESQYLNFFNLNMTGKKLIGIYANHNVAHALCQGTGLSISKAFMFNGKSYQSLGEIYDKSGEDKDGRRISRNIAEFLAASVDNAKDPVLAKLWQNDNTASTTCFLLRLGVPVEQLMNLYKSLLNYTEKTKQGEINMFEKFMEKGPSAFKGRDGFIPSKGLEDPKNFFNFLGEYADTISNIETLNGLLKCDSTNGAMYDLSDIASKQININKLRKDKNLTGLNNVLPEYNENSNLLFMNKKEITKLLGDAAKSFQVAYYLTYANYKQYFKDVIDPQLMNEIVSLGSQLPRFTTDNIKSFITEYTKQQLRYLDYFKPSMTQKDGKIVIKTTSDKINECLESIPMKLEQYKRKYPDNMFIKMLTRIETENGNYLTIRNISEMRSETVNEVKSAFNELFSSMSGRKDANDLIHYTLCINGFGYSPLSFISMIPLKSMAKIKGIDSLYQFFEIDNLDEFEDDFIINNKLVERVDYKKQNLVNYDGEFLYPSTSKIISCTESNKFTGEKILHYFKKVMEIGDGTSVYTIMEDKNSKPNDKLYDIINNEIMPDEILGNDRSEMIESIVADVVKEYNKQGLDIDNVTADNIKEMFSKGKAGRFYSLNSNPLENYSPISIEWCN